MEDPNFMSWEFTVKFDPANALSRTLYLLGMTNFRHALLTLTGEKKFQIKADIYDHPGALSLEMGADSIFANFDTDGYCLRFNAHDWYEQIKDPMIEITSYSISIQKSPGSTDVHCLLGEENQLIELGKAEFVRRTPVHHYDPFSYVRVTIGGVMFRQFLDSFSSKHDHGVSIVQLRITRSNISWLTPRGDFDYPLHDYMKDGVILLNSFQFRVRWNWALFQMLQSAALCSDGVELTVFDNSIHERLYRFRFLFDDGSYCISYVEKEPAP